MTPGLIDIAAGPTALLQIASSDSREIVRITHSGEVIVNPEFTVDEAAKAFWDAVRELAAGTKL